MLKNDRPDVLPNPVGVCGNHALKCENHVYDSLDDLRNVNVNGKPSILLKDSTFKRYVEQRLEIHFHFRLLSADRKADLGEYCAVILSAVSDLDMLAPGRANRATERLRLGHGQEFVFVSGIQFLKEPELIWLALRSCVRLDIANGVQCAWMKHMIKLTTFDHSIESDFGFVNREKRHSVSEIAPRQSPSDVVESASKVVNTVTDNERQSDLRNRFSDLQGSEICKLFVIVFFDEGIGLRIEKCPNFCIENPILFFSAGDLISALD